ncbi:MAG: FtsX-like permease family protein [Candidatus Aegiribacteria sp.]|nr:FtsX-like permease family protein [Candidatus Aegiribacteria sp.]MBD3295586.1 FtsX-like permease family protein [Candidatus Fermentibacteria bacterium]
MLAKILVLSWRSIWRNTRRTLITALAVGFGLASLLFTEGLMKGMESHMINATTDPWMGDAQIHREGFTETGKIQLSVNSGDSIITMLSSDTAAVAYTPRVIAPASLSSARELKPVTLMGVDVGTDSGVTMLDSAIDTGAYLSGDSMEIILGCELSEDLKADLGDVLVITAAQVDSGLSSRMFRLSGICSFGSEKLDRYSAFVNIQAARGLLGMGQVYHELAVRMEDPLMASDGSLPFFRRYSIFGNVARGWPELAPQIDTMRNMIDISMLILSAILFGLVVFGIVNSLFMSVYERMFELGIMKAVGTRPATLFFMVIMEAFWLGVISMAAGILMGALSVWVTSRTGISFGDIEFSGITFNRPIYPELTAASGWIYPVFTLLLTAFAGVFPGIHAAGQNPAESMRRSL